MSLTPEQKERQLKFWTEQLEYCREELTKEENQDEYCQKDLLDEIEYAKNNIAEIYAGTYEIPRLCFATIVIDDPLNDQEYNGRLYWQSQLEYLSTLEQTDDVVETTRWAKRKLKDIRDGVYKSPELGFELYS